MKSTSSIVSMMSLRLCAGDKELLNDWKVLYRSRLIYSFFGIREKNLVPRLQL